MHLMQTVGGAIAKATANHSVVILIAAGTGIYLLEKKCATPS